MIFVECAISGKKQTVTDMTFTQGLFWDLVTQREISLHKKYVALGFVVFYDI